MKPGETKTLTYCVKLKDSVWENSGNTSDTVKKKFTNKATLTAAGMEEDKSATTTVNLKKKWISDVCSSDLWKKISLRQQQ